MPHELSDTAEVIRRLNDVFQGHDPTDLPGLVGDDCVLENTRPRTEGIVECGYVKGAA